MLLGTDKTDFSKIRRLQHLP